MSLKYDVKCVTHKNMQYITFRLLVVDWLAGNINHGVTESTSVSEIMTKNNI